MEKFKIIGMFDFRNRNLSWCLKNRSGANLTVNDFAHAVLKEDMKEKLPEKVTIYHLHLPFTLI